MKVQDYCKAMKAEVTAWKEKLEAMKKTADGFGSEQKEKVLAADRAARAGGRRRANEGGSARKRVSFRLVTDKERT
jgi:hypothetical protein